MEKKSVAKLSEEDVRNIRKIARGKTQNAREIAQFYGLAAETIRRVIRGETWTHVRMTDKTDAELEVEAQASVKRMLEMIAADKEKKAAGDKMLKELSGEATPGINPAYDFLKTVKNPLDE